MECTLTDGNYKGLGGLGISLVGKWVDKKAEWLQNWETLDMCHRKVPLLLKYVKIQKYIFLP